MPMLIKAPKDFWSGMIFVAFGVGFVAVAREYPMGSALEMGAAYFPTLVGGLLAIMGVVLVGSSTVKAGEAIGHIGIRIPFLVVGALVLFGYLLDWLGLIPAIIALIFVGSAGGHEFRFWEVLIFALVVAAMAVGIFSFVLGVPLKLGPQL
ncbi:MAG TPA: tripartite tricarboxylate transporter TctB family protein [Burkholderiaceae bacterium]|nr:tripartite tricarboxylate transporter TctB family protein [Burkholderiaceae bacterium]